MTKHVMRKTVNTKMKITMFFKVGRSLASEEMREPTLDVCAVLLFKWSSSLTTEVEFNCVWGEGIICGSPSVFQATAKTKIKTEYNRNIVLILLYR
uniref:Uncharacterized protein n=1 Tax=Anguilla anguilla TaxID=7936 RepID=A0A0E9XBP0_ANGAN